MAKFSVRRVVSILNSTKNIIFGTLPKMESVKYDKKNLTAHYVISPIPRIESEEEIVVKVSIAGICGTDLHILKVSKNFCPIFLDGF